MSYKNEKYITRKYKTMCCISSVYNDTISNFAIILDCGIG